MGCGAAYVCVFASGGLDAAGVQAACGGHRDDAQLERTLREPDIDRMAGSAGRLERAC